MVKHLKQMDIQTFITQWIKAGNAFDAKQYLDFYLPDAILDDPSVGRKFIGHQGIREYYESYFIGYHTHTTQVALLVKDEENAHLEVEFTGDFPEGKLRGTFDFQFKNGKIAAAKADLVS